MAEDVLERKSTLFALEIIRLVQKLRGNHEYVFADQILRSGTSIGANLSEAHYAQSRADFASKMNIALKEANESRYWLLLMEKGNIISNEDYSRLYMKCDEICILLIRSMQTLKSRTPK